MILGAIPGPMRRLHTRIRSSPLGYRLAHGAFWSVGGAVAGRVFGLVTFILVARLLGKEGFGQLGMVQATVLMFQVLAGFGMGVTATKHVAEFRHADPRRAGRIIVLTCAVTAAVSVLVAAASFFLAPLLAGETLKEPSLAPALRAGSFLLFFGAIGGVQTGILAGLEAFRALAGLTLLVGAAGLPLVVGGSHLGGPAGAVWGLAITTAAGCVANQVALRSAMAHAGIPVVVRGSMAECSALWRFGIPAMVGSLLAAPANWICAALLVNMGGGFAEMGVFSAADRWRMLIMFVPGHIGRVVLPMLSHVWAGADRGKYRKLLGVSLGVSVGLAAILAGAVALMPGFVMSWYGEGFSAGRSVLIVLAGVGVLMAAIHPLAQAVASMGKMWVRLGFDLIRTAVLIVAALALVPGYHALGLALANLAAFSVLLVCYAGYAYGRILRGPQA